MSGLIETPVEDILATCTENSAAIAECLNQCFDTSHTLEIGDPDLWSTDDDHPGIDGPGLLVGLEVEDHTLLCAIPQTLPLPDWYTDPGDSERSRLETLAMEWSMNLLPASLECSQFTTVICEDLAQSITDCEPSSSATVMPIKLAEGDQTIWMIWPVTKFPKAAEDESSDEAAQSSPQQPAEPQTASVQDPSSQAPSPRIADPFALVRHITVPVVVTLAERRIEVEELTALCPGAIVTFDKACEDLLELRVNDQIYARGEAVKIGEKFGLKVSEIGYVPQREPRVLT